MALWSSTSRPKRKTRGSRAISWATPSQSASTYLKIRCWGTSITPVGAWLGVDIRIKFLRLRKRALLRELNRGRDFTLDFGIETRLDGSIKLRANYRDLVVLDPRAQLVTR